MKRFPLLLLITLFLGGTAEADDDRDCYMVGGVGTGLSTAGTITFTSLADRSLTTADFIVIPGGTAPNPLVPGWTAPVRLVAHSLYVGIDNAPGTNKYWDVEIASGNGQVLGCRIADAETSCTTGPREQIELQKGDTLWYQSYHISGTPAADGVMRFSFCTETRNGRQRR